jgi:hypothetical protein
MTHKKLLHEATINLNDDISNEWILDFERKLQCHLKKTFIFPEGFEMGPYKALTECKITVRNIHISYRKDPGFFWVCLYIRPKDCSGEVICRQRNTDFQKPVYELINYSDFFLEQAIETFFKYLSMGKDKARILIYDVPQDWYRMNAHYKTNRLQ